MFNRLTKHLREGLVEVCAYVYGTYLELVVFIKRTFFPTNEILAEQYSSLLNWFHRLMTPGLLIASYYIATWIINFEDGIRSVPREASVESRIFTATFICFVVLRVTYTFVMGFLTTFISINAKLDDIAKFLNNIKKDTQE